MSPPSTSSIAVRGARAAGTRSSSAASRSSVVGRGLGRRTDGIPARAVRRRRVRSRSTPVHADDRRVVVAQHLLPRTAGPCGAELRRAARSGRPEPSASPASRAARRAARPPRCAGPARHRPRSALPGRLALRLRVPVGSCSGSVVSLLSGSDPAVPRHVTLDHAIAARRSPARRSQVRGLGSAGFGSAALVRLSTAAVRRIGFCSAVGLDRLRPGPDPRAKRANSESTSAKIGAAAPSGFGDALSVVALATCRRTLATSSSRCRATSD